ncbi:MAG: hypothetical protein HFJ25_02025 [Clostridia bacterium]|nr:hypothetical protein [Clostridia bacterium]
MVGMLSYLISFLGILFWILRVVVVFCATMQMDFGIQPINLNLEILLLFVSIPCFALILKRNLGGAFVYFIAFTAYFGNDLYNCLVNSTGSMQTILIDALGVILPLLSLIDIAVNRDRMGTSEDKKTVWFYGNKDFDRKLDERADTNNYRT